MVDSCSHGLCDEGDEMGTERIASRRIEKSTVLADGKTHGKHKALRSAASVMSSRTEANLPLISAWPHDSNHQNTPNMTRATLDWTRAIPRTRTHRAHGTHTLSPRPRPRPDLLARTHPTKEKNGPSVHLISSRLVSFTRPKVDRIVYPTYLASRSSAPLSPALSTTGYCNVHMDACTHARTHACTRAGVPDRETSSACAHGWRCATGWSWGRAGWLLRMAGLREMALRGDMVHTYVVLVGR
jgi:hypothetical protein